jgi:DNA polymerase II small subunit
MRAEVLTTLKSIGIFAQPEAVEHIATQKDPIAYIHLILEKLDNPPLVLTMEHIASVDHAQEFKGESKTAEDNQVGEIAQKWDLKEKALEPKNEVKEKREISTPPVRDEEPSKEPEPDIQILKDVTGNSTCQGTLSDFRLLFNDRFKLLSKMLRRGQELYGALPLDRLRTANNPVKAIGMVSDFKITKNGHKRIDLEDETGSYPILFLKDSELARDPTVTDEVIGIIGNLSTDGNLLIAQEVRRPDIPLNHVKKSLDQDISIAFISDIHMGSKTFLNDEFNNFLEWLDGHVGNHRELAKTIRYLVISGDAVDGIGIYPDQEKDLIINDIYSQYEELAVLLSKIPDYIKIILQPGNHDAVRPAEPQPAFPDEIKKLFKPNVTFVGNPCCFKIHGYEILAYHGRSFDDFIRALPNLDYSHALKIMIEMLKKRHLSPIYGGRTPLAPEHRDYMVIDTIPDIFVTGHGHAAEIGSYRGVRLINASAWQSQTSFQRMHNIVPNPAKVPVVNLKSGNSSMISFSG